MGLNNTKVKSKIPIIMAIGSIAFIGRSQP
jgi:hypothetical protein